MVTKRTQVLTHCINIYFSVYTSLYALNIFVTNTMFFNTDPTFGADLQPEQLLRHHLGQSSTKSKTGNAAFA